MCVLCVRLWCVPFAVKKCCLEDILCVQPLLWFLMLTCGVLFCFRRVVFEFVVKECVVFECVRGLCSFMFVVFAVKGGWAVF